MIGDDTLQRVLFIDLSAKSTWVENRRELFEKYLGGAGIAIRLLHEECRTGTDPLSPGNPIIFSVGPLTGVFPMASKTVAMFKSPLTGNLGESHAGGRSAIAIRMAGYGAIVIKGSSETPVYLAIDGEKVHFRDASVIWGMGSSFTVGRIIRSKESGAGLRTIMRIGKAGEKLIAYACVVTETYRHFGRLGLGAVFGSKKLKALAISGRHLLKVKDAKLYRDVYKEIFDNTVKSPSMKKYHDIGTAININPLNELKALPTENLKTTYLDDAQKISGENLAEKYLGRRIACAHCPVSCIHLAAHREPYKTEPYFYKTVMISYDYELIYALGSMLKVSCPEGLFKIIDVVEEYGLDAMSTGVVLAWATEAQQRNLVSTEDCQGIQLRWGNHESYIKAVRYLVDQPNEFYKTLAKGVWPASTKFGGSEFALSFGGNEMPGYHTGPATHIGYLIGSRHSHLDGAGYSIDQKLINSGITPTPESIAKSLIEEEQWRQVLSSLVVCYFARGIYNPDVIIKALDVVGYEIKPDELTNISGKILREKFNFKIREGFDPEKLVIPNRIFETRSLLGMITEDLIRKGISSCLKILSDL